MKTRDRALLIFGFLHIERISRLKLKLASETERLEKLSETNAAKILGNAHHIHLFCMNMPT